MSLIYFQLISIAIVTAIACVIPGNFLILEGKALMSDAISHAILCGIVVAFLLVENPQSPWLYIGALICGYVTITATSFLTASGNISQDAAIGLIFPFLFSIAVLLINLYADHVHLDTDAILLGELVFAPFDKLYLYNYDFGPQSLWIMSMILISNITIIWYFYTHLHIISFDPWYAKTRAYESVWIHQIIIIMTTVTIIQGFHAIGTIAVISSMITPAASAWLISKKLYQMIMISCLLATLGVVTGCIIAHSIDSSFAGSICLAHGLIFLGIMLNQKHIAC